MRLDVMLYCINVFLNHLVITLNSEHVHQYIYQATHEKNETLEVPIVGINNAIVPALSLDLCFTLYLYHHKLIIDILCVCTPALNVL